MYCCSSLVYYFYVDRGQHMRSIFPDFPDDSAEHSPRSEAWAENPRRCGHICWRRRTIWTIFSATKQMCIPLCDIRPCSIIRLHDAEDQEEGYEFTFGACMSLILTASKAPLARPKTTSLEHRLSASFRSLSLTSDGYVSSKVRRTTPSPYNRDWRLISVK